MGHDHLKGVEAETIKASGLLIGTLMGGMLVVSSFVVEVPAVARTLFQYDATTSSASSNPYSDMIALVGAILLGVPLVWHALQCLMHGHSHMDELVALAVVAAIALGEYQEAGIIAFFMIVSSLIETRTALGARALHVARSRGFGGDLRDARRDGGHQPVGDHSARGEDTAAEWGEIVPVPSSTSLDEAVDRQASRS